MILANKPVDCDEGRTKTFVDRDESRKQASLVLQVRMQRELHWTSAYLTVMKIATNNSIFVRQSERSTMQGDLHGRINEIDRKDVHESELIHGNEDCQRRKKERINNQLDCDCCRVSLPWREVHGYRHSQPTQKGLSSLNKLDNKPDCFFYNPKRLVGIHNNSVEWEQSHHTWHLPR